ncbi:MAG: hypothetical protein P4L33_10970 [Capsulimonadaceae bacterium]|nr:hypothetical protein [Capsulimonadaceae bacterium]
MRSSLLRIAVGISALCLFGASCAHGDDHGRIDINATKVLGPVNRLVFGHNMEAADGAGIFGPIGRPFSSIDGEGTWDDKNRRPDPAAVAIAREVGLTVLRYPGGCLVHNFDWKLTVGPLESRPNWHFGLDEYLQVCKAMNAVPLITISDYRDTPQDAADLVDYLNMPATPAHPWAMKRAAWGHPAPYHVRYFELGNESNHGNHFVKPHRVYSASDYAEYALATGKAMKAVDPKIQLGLQAANGCPPDDPWNKTVYRAAGSIADFIIIHRYPVSIHEGNAREDPMLIAQACMAAGEQEDAAIQGHLAEMHKYLKRDLPIAMTEYNVGAVQDAPSPYRFGYAEGLYCADYLRILLQPKSHMLMANYWQLWNGYWGMVIRRGGTDEYKPNPAFAFYKLWAHHFGDMIVATETQTPRLDFPGFSAVHPTAAPAAPVPGQPALPRTLPLALESKTISSCAKLSVEPAGELTFDIAGATGKSYPLFGRVARPADAAPGAMYYRISCEAKFVPNAGGAYAPIGLGLCDTRGWDATESAVALPGLGQAKDWQQFSTTFLSLPTCPGVDLVARIEPEEMTVSGTLHVRKLRLELINRPTLPPYAALTSTASLSKDHKTLYVMVFNKSADRDISAPVVVRGFHPAEANGWLVNAASLAGGSWSKPSDREVETKISVPLDQQGAATLVFPAHSMTAIELTAK